MDLIQLTGPKQSRVKNPRRHKTEQHVPRNVEPVLTPIQEPVKAEQSTFDGPKVMHFIDILSEGQKLYALKSVLDGIQTNLNWSGRFKMVIVATSAVVPMLDNWFRAEYPQLPVKNCRSHTDLVAVDQFQQGVVLLALPADATMMLPAIPGVDFLLVYDYLAETELEMLLRVAKTSATDRSFAILFISPHLKLNAKKLLSYLRDNKKTINAPAASTLQKILDGLLEPALITEGNLAAFNRKMRSENIRNGSCVSHFVEVLSAEDKPTALLELVDSVFRITGQEGARMLVFVANASLKTLESSLCSGLAKLAVPVSTIDSQCPDYKAVLASFRTGVLLVAEHFFRATNQSIGANNYVQFVVNYDFSAYDGLKGEMHLDYTHRLSNISAVAPTGVVTFISRQNLEVVDQLVSVLEQFQQEVNPYLVQIKADKDPKKTLSVLKANTERHLVDSGNMKAFIGQLKATKSTKVALPSPSPEGCRQFKKVSSPEQTMATLLGVVKRIVSEFRADSLKILVFKRGLVKECVQTTDNIMRDGLEGVSTSFTNLNRLYSHCKDPPSIIQHNFKLFVELPNAILFTDVDSRYLGINKADFVIFYDPPNSWDIYLDAVARFKPVNSSLSYLLTFLPSPTHALADRLCKLGDLTDLYTALRPPLTVPVNCLQFVEVLPLDQKQFMFLHLTQKVFETWIYGRLKILVFVRGLVPEKIKELDTLLQSTMAQGVASSCERLFVPCQCSDAGMVQRSLHAFREQERAIFITDIDSRFIGVDAVDFVIFYDSPNKLDVYVDALNRFKPVNSSFIYFTTFITAGDTKLPADLVEMFGKINWEILPKTTATTLGNSVEIKNVATLLKSLHNPSLPPIVGGHVVAPAHLPFTPHLLKPKNECLQYIEVLTIDEKVDTLLDLFKFLFTLKMYKHLKIIIFVRNLTTDRTEQFANLIESVIDSSHIPFPDFGRFYAYGKSSSLGVIEWNLKAFGKCLDGVLVTDVDCRYLGVNTADYIVFYDSPASADIYLDSLSRFSGENSNHTIFVTFLLATDYSFTEKLFKILNDFNNPINPLIFKLIDRTKHTITDSAIRTLRPTIKTGNLNALYNMKLDTTSTTPYTTFTQLRRKFPSCIIEWLTATTGNTPGTIQSHVWPVMFSKMDLLAIAPNSEERIITFVLAAITWIMSEVDHLKIAAPHPIVAIFAPSQESVKQIQALIKMLGLLLASNGYEVYLSQLILVEQPVGIFDHNFGHCKYVVFDEFDKMMSLGHIDEVAHILLQVRDEKMFDGDVCLSIFSAQYSVFEKLVSLVGLENYHYFNYAEVTGEQIADCRGAQIFSNISQYVEVSDVGRRRMKSLCSVLKRILTSAADEKFAVVVFMACKNDDAALFAVYNRLLTGLPEFAKQIFYNKKDFADETERAVYWHHFKAQRNQVYLTNDSRKCEKVQRVKYVINFDFPIGLLSLFEYLQRMTSISCKNASVVSYFGLDDFPHSEVFAELLAHMKQKTNLLLYELKMVAQQPNISHATFNDELREVISRSTGDLVEFVDELGRSKRHRSSPYDDRASTSSGSDSKRYRIK